MIKLSWLSPLLCLPLLSCQPVRFSTNFFSLEINEASVAHIEVYRLGETYPPIKRFLGEVYGYSCRAEQTEPPASESSALTALKLDARDVGAHAVIDVEFHRSGNLTDVSDCLELIEAHGRAVEQAD